MGKCKVCGAHIDDSEIFCEDCKVLSEADTIKSEEELDQILDTFEHTDSSLHMDNNETDSKEDTIQVDPLQAEEENEILGELNEITDSLLNENEEDSNTSQAIHDEEPFSIDSLQDEEEPFSIDSLMIEEEPQEESAEKSMNLADTVSDLEEEIGENTVSSIELENDALSAFSGIFEGIDDMEEESGDENSSDLGNIISDVLGNITNKSVDKEIEKQETSKAKEKVGFFKSLFSNVEDEHAEETLKKEQEKEEKRRAKKDAKQEEKIAAKAKKKAAAEEKKKQKQSLLAEKKVQKEKEAAEEVKDTSKINKKGATVILFLVALLGVGIIAGTNIFQYSLSISKAKDNFSKKKYEEAYDMISGIDVKKADRQIEKKIKTVMYVNKELISYQNYYTIQYHAEALNSLLNGLTKYNVYLEQAGKLGVKTDLEYVKDQIVKELKDKYNLTEEQAGKILEISDRVEYSDKVIAIAKKMAEKK